MPPQVGPYGPTGGETMFEMLGDLFHQFSTSCTTFLNILFWVTLTGGIHWLQVFGFLLGAEFLFNLGKPDKSKRLPWSDAAGMSFYLNIPLPLCGFFSFVSAKEAGESTFSAFLTPVVNSGGVIAGLVLCIVAFSLIASILMGRYMTFSSGNHYLQGTQTPSRPSQNHSRKVVRTSNNLLPVIRKDDTTQESRLRVVEANLDRLQRDFQDVFDNSPDTLEDTMEGFEVVTANVEKED